MPTHSPTFFSARALYSPMSICLPMDLPPGLPPTPLGTSHVITEGSNHPKPGLASAPARSGACGRPRGARSDSLATRGMHRICKLRLGYGGGGGGGFLCFFGWHQQRARVDLVTGQGSQRLSTTLSRVWQWLN